MFIPLLFGIMLIIFLLFKLAPGDPLSGRADPKLSAERKTELRVLWGLDKPVPEQFVIWLRNIVLKGNFGNSFKFSKPVLDVIGDYIWNSFLLALPATILSFAIAIPLGVLSATKQYSLYDSAMTVFAMVGISVPAFFFILIMMKYLGVDLRLLPISGMRTATADYTGVRAWLDVGWHMIIPLTVYVFGEVAYLMRYVRSSMLEVVRQDYIRTARSKGLKERVVIYKHALRNALIPTVTLLGLSISGLFVGGLITEELCQWPGVGKIMYEAVLARDYNLLMGYNLLLAFLTLFGNLLADIAYALVDPRVRLGGGSK
jgi:peptide/nickel transport system permease protein